MKKIFKHSEIMKYTEVDFAVNPMIPFSEILMAELSEVGFDSFAETETGLQAFVPTENFDRNSVEGILSLLRNCEITYDVRELPDQNWNEEWEKTNLPVMIDGFCWVYPPSFQPNADAEYNIVINPKMSFGTAHHPTTYLILKMLGGLNLAGKRVLDMGTGTGVLAILAEKKGASFIEAVDIDEWAYRNVLENIGNNGCEKITALLGDASLLTPDKDFDVVIANINRNILLRDMERYIGVLDRRGTLILSGFYESDLPDIRQGVEAWGLAMEACEVKEDWAVVRFIR